MATIRVVSHCPNALGIAFFSSANATRETETLFDEIVTGWRAALPHN